MKEHKIAIIFITVLAVLIFFPFLIKGLLPFPGDYLLAWYEPWKTNSFINGKIAISHKPVADDVLRQLYPYKIFEAKLLKDIQLPLWNPYNGAGMPFLATMHSGILNPINVLFIFLSGPIAWTIYVALQPILLGIGMYLYARRVGISLYGSLFAVGALILSGVVIARLLYGEYIYCFSYLPIILYCIESFIQRRDRRIFFLPLVIMLLFFSGQPQIILYTLLFSLIYSMYRLTQENQFYTNILLLLLLFGIGTSLAAIQLLPTLELFKNAAIDLNTSKFIFNRFLLPPQHIFSLLIPNYFGNQSTYNYWGSGDYIETIGSIGLIPLFFALGIFNKKNKYSFFYIASILISIFSTIDWFGPRLFFSLPIPILSTGIPSRIFILTTFSIAILAGFGLDIWNSNKNKINKPQFFFIFIVGLINLITFFAFFYNFNCNNVFITNCRSIALRNTILETAVFVVFLFATRYWSSSSKISKIFPIIIITIIGLYNANKFLPFSKPQTFLPSTDVTKEIVKITRPDRITGFGNAAIKTDFATYFNYFDPNFYDPLYNKRYGELVNYGSHESSEITLSRSDIELSNSFSLDDKKQARLLELLNVKYFLFKNTESPKELTGPVWRDNNWSIYKNNNAVPKAYFVNNVIPIPSDSMILSKLFSPSFNPLTQAVVEKNIPELKENSSTGNVLIKKYTENKITLETQTRLSKFLVLSDNYYQGWHVYIDGKETELYRTNYTFKGVVVPAGIHTISFSYNPSSLKIGELTSGASLLIYLFILLREKIRSYKHNR